MKVNINLFKCVKWITERKIFDLWIQVRIFKYIYIMLVNRKSSMLKKMHLIGHYSDDTFTLGGLVKHIIKTSFFKVEGRLFSFLRQVPKILSFGNKYKDSRIDNLFPTLSYFYRLFYPYICQSYFLPKTITKFVRKIESFIFLLYFFQKRTLPNSSKAITTRIRYCYCYY